MKNTYENLTGVYKVERMSDILAQLIAGESVPVDVLFLEEIKWLKAEFGNKLRKVGNVIFVED